NPLILAQLTAALTPTTTPPHVAIAPANVGAKKNRSLLTPTVGAQHATPQVRTILPSSSPSSTIEIFPSSHLGVPTDAKEAYAFALMAYETLHQRPSNLPSATGANHSAILGKISYAPPR